MSKAAGQLHGRGRLSACGPGCRHAVSAASLESNDMHGSAGVLPECASARCIFFCCVFERKKTAEGSIGTPSNAMNHSMLTYRTCRMKTNPTMPPCPARQPRRLLAASAGQSPSPINQIPKFRRRCSRPRPDLVQFAARVDRPTPVFSMCRATSAIAVNATNTEVLWDIDGDSTEVRVGTYQNIVNSVVAQSWTSVLRVVLQCAFGQTAASCWRI